LLTTKSHKVSESNISIVAEPYIPYRKERWFPQPENTFTFFENVNPYSGSTTQYEEREFDNTLEFRSEETIDSFSFLFFYSTHEQLDRSISIEQRPNKRKKFEYYMQQWKFHRNSKSSILDSLSDLNYQNIIGMGKQALPFIFREMRKEYDDWFDALYEITGKDPVKEENYGDFVEMTNDWILWAKIHKYL